MKAQKAWLKPAKTPAELLQRGVDLLSRPNRWTQGFMATTSHKPVMTTTHFWDQDVRPALKPTSEQAEAFCSIGCVDRVKDGTPRAVVNQAVILLGQAMYPTYLKIYPGTSVERPTTVADAKDIIIDVNDATPTTRRKILALWKAAVKAARA